jgi:hypothetical protein
MEKQGYKYLLGNFWSDGDFGQKTGRKSKQVLVPNLAKSR